MFVTSPLDLNDPFEMRPAWTTTHEKRFHANQLNRSEMTTGMPLLLCTEAGLVDSGQLLPAIEADPLIDVEQQRGISDSHNAVVFRHLHAKYRILSFVSGLMPEEQPEFEAEKSTLMWSHYADQFQGVCVALDPDEFYNGIEPGGYSVNYAPDRCALPSEDYDTFLKVFCPQPLKTGNVVDPSTGLELTPAQKAALDQHRFIDILTHKSRAWKYEHEVRMIYDLAELKRCGHHKDIWQSCPRCKLLEVAHDACADKRHKDAVIIPANAVRAVIFGNDCLADATAEILDVLADQRYQHVELYWCSLHSDKYMVQYNRRDADYIRFIQKHRAEEMASAKGHVRDGDNGTEVKVSPKGVNYPHFGQPG